MEINEQQDLIDELYDEYYDPSNHTDPRPDYDRDEYDAQTRFERLDVTDVFPTLPVDERCAHPVHGSEQTGSNFIVDSDGGRATCWRCQYGAGEGAGMNAQVLLAMDALDIERCGEARDLYKHDDMAVWVAWRTAKKNYDHLMLGSEPPPYRAVRWVVSEHVDLDVDTEDDQHILDAGGKDAWVAYRVACAWIESEHGISVDADADRKGEFEQ